MHKPGDHRQAWLPGQRIVHLKSVSNHNLVACELMISKTKKPVQLYAQILQSSAKGILLVMCGMIFFRESTSVVV